MFIALRRGELGEVSGGGMDGFPPHILNRFAWTFADWVEALSR